MCDLGNRALYVYANSLFRRLEKKHIHKGKTGWIILNNVVSGIEN